MNEKVKRGKSTYVHVVEALEDVRQLPVVCDVLVDLDLTLEIIW